MAIALAGTCDPALDNLPLEVLGLPGDISINEQSRDGVCDAVGAANTTRRTDSMRGMQSVVLS